MIEAKEAVRTARGLLGTPYSEMDCMALIRAVIRRSPGGASDYRCQGTNWLWSSVNNSGRYRHLTWRQEGLAGACAGMLAFKCRGADVHHTGLVTGEGTVIHSSSAYGKVVETALDESWQLLGIHRDIGIGQAAQGEAETAAQGEAETAAQGEAEAASGAGITIIDAQGRRFCPAGDFRVVIGSLD